MNLTFLFCAFAVSVMMPLQAVRVINNSGHTCYLSKFKLLAPDGQRLLAPIEEQVLVDGEVREFDDIEYFCVRRDFEEFSRSILDLDNSIIVTIVYREGLDEYGDEYEYRVRRYLQICEISSKDDF